MSAPLRPDLCIIGAGSGGLSVAAGAVQMGASVVLIEGHKMGGDCLNYGCVPSKALIAAAKAAEAQRTSGKFGIAPQTPQIDYSAVMDHVHGVIAGIAPHDSVERFEGLGVHVIEGRARFTGPREVAVNDQIVQPRRFVVATGSSPAVPPIPGLDSVPYMTNETLWDLRTLPEHLVIIGGGPIGLEMAQAHLRLGSKVSLLDLAPILSRDDAEVAEAVRARLIEDGIALMDDLAATGNGISRVDTAPEGIVVTLENGETISGSHLLVATGRAANVSEMGLDEAGIEHDRKGIKVTPGLRSVSNSRVYAIGDVAGGLQFTHVAGYQAGLVIRNALFRLPVRNRTDLIPRVTYIDPEIAQVGLTETEAHAKHGDAIETARFDMAENDRARAELKTTGFAKAVIGRRGRILGCSIYGASAGELIQPWCLAISKGLKIGDMAGHVAAYPTLGEVSKRAAGAYYTPRLFQSDRVKFIVRLLARLG